MTTLTDGKAGAQNPGDRTSAADVGEPITLELDLPPGDDEAGKGATTTWTVAAWSAEDEKSIRDALREDVVRHIESLGLPGSAATGLSTKDSIRTSHAPQRRAAALKHVPRLETRWNSLMDRFASGRDIDPTQIDPEIVPVRTNTDDADLFRLASLLWSVPVSNGYGRRMRFLVVDRSNGKLIGIFALGDPVFNLRARDQWIGWSTETRSSRLVNVMDAYVVGAVPPYSILLGGKLVTSLIGSREVSDAFLERYGSTSGIISGESKGARLALVTVTSALGRSSIYNRVHLADSKGKSLVRLVRIGATSGFGHFQLSDELFERLRVIVRRKGHEYADGNRYGLGPNWKIRLIRVGLSELGLDPNLIRHGITRDVYAMELASNSRAYLRGEEQLSEDRRPAADEIGEAARRRWIEPRAERRPEYQLFEVGELEARLRGWSPVAARQQPLGLRIDRAEKLGNEWDGDHPD